MIPVAALTAAVCVISFFRISVSGASINGNNISYTINDIRNLQDFLLARETSDLSGKEYDLNDDGRWDVFDLCLMKQHYNTEHNQTIYLWNEDNMPTATKNISSSASYADPVDFHPNMIYVPAAENTKIKGAVLICPGGAFQFRSENEGTPVAKELSKLGYQCFVVNYRVRPYTMEEGSLDLARAVRYVRSHASQYRISEDDIAVMGFSAGGTLCGDLLLNFDGTVDGTILDKNYIPDELDKVSADASAVGMIYSFYGRLSVASADVEKFRQSDLPPTYLVYGTRDPFVSQFEKCVAALKEAEVSVESHVLDGMPHGFGARGGWIAEYDKWLTDIFES